MRRIPLTFAVVCFTTLMAASAMAQSWQSSTPAPVPMSQLSIAADDDGRIYVFNGKTQYSFSPLLFGLDCAFRFDICTGSWETISFPGWTTYGGGAAHHPDGDIYWTGGLTGSPGLLKRYDIDSNSWSTLTPAPTATNSYKPAIVVDEYSGLVHWIGGEDFGSEHNAYNPLTDSWSSFPAAPLVGGFGQGAVFDPATGNIILITGWAGNNEETGAATNAVQIYDPDTNNWSLGASMPGGTGFRYMHSVAANPADGLIYVFGGSENYFDGNPSFYNDTWTYNPTTNVWTNLSVLNPQGGNREAGGAFDQFGNFHVIGGNDGGGPTDRHEFYGNGIPDADGDGDDACSDCDDNDAFLNNNDADNDGVSTCDGDCDDSDASINPGATEVCDGVDNDCDGAIDEGFDQDNDGWTTCAGDCDDNNPNANPDCPDICNGIDDDCDGEIDEDFDADGDGYTTCGGDCDDGDASVNPGATEVCDGVDNDCDGQVDEGFDADNDGWTTCGGDCDDNNPNTNPDCPDICNGVDDDCDGEIDEDFDADGDGYTTCGGDCDDNDASINPGAEEECDGIDNDCDGDVDEEIWSVLAAPTDSWAQYGGGHAVVFPGVGSFVFDPAGAFVEHNDGTATWSATAVGISDPNDILEIEATFSGRTTVAGPGSPKLELDPSAYVANGGPVDPTTWHYYEDWTGTAYGDGDLAGAELALVPTGPNFQVGEGANGKNIEFGAAGWIAWTVVSQPASGSLPDGSNGDWNVDLTGACDEICDGIDNDGDGDIDEGFDQDNDGWTTCAGDCDDNNPGANPDCPDICNGIDDDCDGEIDEDFDADGDGYTTCGGDCDDDDASVNPGATEVCNGVDADCDGVIPADETDDDGDGVSECDGDCDDADATTYPGAPELCDGVDNDCDGVIPAEETDDDNDGWTECDGDCDDTNPNVNPDCPDVCNGIDDDCDGEIDEDFDQDGDGYTSCGGDCDDDDPAVNPDATEVCDGVDNDCDGVIPSDETQDVDGDGAVFCDDCDDWDPNRFPGNPEICDGLDNDCDGLADEGFDNDGDGISDCIDECPTTLEYEEDPWGNVVTPGEDVSNTYAASLGVFLEAYTDPNLVDPWVPVATDLLGNDGNAVTAPADMTDADGDGLVDDLTPHPGNSWFLYTFNSGACVHSIDLIDVDTGELPAQVILFDVNVQTITTITSAALGDGTTETLDLGGICGVYVVMIDFYADGGFDNFEFCIGGTEEVCDDGVDNDGDGDVDEDCEEEVIPDDDDDVGDDDDDENEADDDDEEEEDPDCSMAGDRVSSSRLGVMLLLGLAAIGLRRRQ